MPVVFLFYQDNRISRCSSIHCHCINVSLLKNGSAKALYLILISEKFQQIRIKILLATEFTLNGHAVDFVFIRLGQNWLKTIKMIGHFRDWNVGLNGFLIMSNIRHLFPPLLLLISDLPYL